MLPTSIKPGILLALLALTLSSCATAPREPDLAPARPAAPVAATPPDDFRIGITLLGPLRAASATAALPRSLRPGRYVVEPDRVLRVSLGAGAQETSFPPQTRRLTPAEFAQLWQAANSAGFLDAAHPNLATGSGEVDPETIQGKTVYVITTHAASRRELLVMETDPECAQRCEQAKGVVDWLAEKAWMSAPAQKE